MFARILIFGILFSALFPVAAAATSVGLFAGVAGGLVFLALLSFFFRYYVWDKKVAPSGDNEKRERKPEDRSRTQDNAAWQKGHFNQGQANQWQQPPPPGPPGPTNPGQPPASNPFASAAQGQQQQSNPFAAAAQGQQQQQSNPFAAAAQGQQQQQPSNPFATAAQRM